MTKQEEIREGMTDIIKHSMPNFIYPFLTIPTRWLVNKLLKYLHSQGLVIKVDGEPVIPESMSQARRFKAQGLTAVEPLIEEHPLVTQLRSGVSGIVQAVEPSVEVNDD